MKHTKNIYLDYDGIGEKPKHLLQMGMRYTSGCDQIQKIWYIDSKIARDHLGRKRKSTRFIYPPSSKFHEAEGHLTMRSCLQYSAVNYVPGIVKYINKLELYRQCPPIIVKDKKMSEIENTSCVINFMSVTQQLVF